MFRLVQQVLQHLSRSLVCQSSVPKDKTSVETYTPEEHMHLVGWQWIASVNVSKVTAAKSFCSRHFLTWGPGILRTSHQRNSGNRMEQRGAPEHVLEYRVLSSFWLVWGWLLLAILSFQYVFLSNAQCLQNRQARCGLNILATSSWRFVVNVAAAAKSKCLLEWQRDKRW